MSNIQKSAYNRKDLSGQSFGKLKAIEYSHTENKRAFWKCLCECGKDHITMGKYLISGDTQSCGCSQLKIFRTKHRESSGLRTKEYRAWVGLKSRCLNKKNKFYHIYGGRGITVCQRWMNSFENFLFDMGRAPSSKHTIDRIENDGDYSFLNCRWATVKEQNNNSSNCVFLEMDGKKQCIAAWAEEYGLSYVAVYKRIRRGWTIQKAVSVPVRIA